jgi:GTP cyclohydrolase I
MLLSHWSGSPARVDITVAVAWGGTGRDEQRQPNFEAMDVKSFNKLFNQMVVIKRIPHSSLCAELDNFP